MFVYLDVILHTHQTNCIRGSVYGWENIELIPGLMDSLWCVWQYLRLSYSRLGRPPSSHGFDFKMACMTLQYYALGWVGRRLNNAWFGGFIYCQKLLY
jgi:hypothetical protein